jgi:Tfp pilus assembly protein PilN
VAFPRVPETRTRIMLRTNLATRPFYNERAVYLVLGALALVGLAVLASLVVRVMDLSARNTDLSAQAELAEREQAELSARTTEVQRGVSTGALEEVAVAAREANTLIDQRVFSWTQFFNRIETTLPPDVMVTLVRPDIAPGSVEVTMGVVGRDLGAITHFIGALEESGAFSRVLNQTAELTDEDMYQAVLRGRYLQDDGPGLGDEPGEAAALTDRTVGASESDPARGTPDAAEEPDVSNSGATPVPPGGGARP